MCVCSFVMNICSSVMRVAHSVCTSANLFVTQEIVFWSITHTIRQSLSGCIATAFRVVIDAIFVARALLRSDALSRSLFGGVERYREERRELILMRRTKGLSLSAIDVAYVDTLLLLL